MKKIFSLILGLFLSFNLTFGADFFLSTNSMSYKVGEDIFHNFDKIATLKAGDRMFLRAGEFFLSTNDNVFCGEGSPTNKVTLSTYLDEKVIIHGNLKIASSFINISNLSLISYSKTNDAFKINGVGITLYGCKGDGFNSIYRITPNALSQNYPILIKEVNPSTNYNNFLEFSDSVGLNLKSTNFNFSVEKKIKP
jgi:Tfp pilus assembly protein PilZ